MHSDSCDIAIVGGGMVGVSIALLLAERLSPQTRVTLLENFPLPERDSEYVNTYTPSFDARSTALSYSSYQIYSELGIWPALAVRACPIQRIHVSEQGRFGNTLLQAQDYDWPALGYVIENAWLGSALVQCLHHQGRVRLHSPARVVSAKAGSRGYRVLLESGESLHTQLLIVADGADSALRQSLGVAVEKDSYAQSALIANVGHRSDHAGCAYERFTGNGPLALLPLLPDAAGPDSRSALVWTLAADEVEHLRSCSALKFLQALQLRFGYRLGRLTRTGERFSYPLALVQTREQVRAGVVLLGNAAHSLHPVAGQGFNLAVRDVAVLASVLAGAQSAGEGLGELAVLQRYVAQQAQDQQRTVAFSHHLPGLFAHPDPALRGLRDLGLFALDLSPQLKREFVEQTAGVSALRRANHRG